MGMFAGGYLYLTVFAPTYESDIGTTEAIDANAIVINAQMYGGCDRTGSCASFRLIDDRSYTYLSYPESDVVKGKLPSDISEAIFDVVGTNTFFNDTQSISPEFCDSYVDGVDYTYTVSLADEVYVLDSCTTAFSNNTAFQDAFLDVWKFMENPTTTYPVIIEEGIGGWLEDRFQNSGE